MLNRKSRFLLLLLVVGWSVVLGSKMAISIDSGAIEIGQTPAKTTQIGKELYLQNCSGCHIPIPPEVLPTETWREILERPEKHYGQSLPSILSINVQLIWQYLNTFSRPLLEDEAKPEYITNSRYFKALHPGVEVPKPVTHQSCILCHPGAKELEYRSLTPEWESG